MENFEQQNFENNIFNNQQQQQTQQLLEAQLDMTNDSTVYAVNNFYADLTIGDVHAMVTSGHTGCPL